MYYYEVSIYFKNKFYFFWFEYIQDSVAFDIYKYEFQFMWFKGEHLNRFKYVDNGEVTSHTCNFIFKINKQYLCRRRQIKKIISKTFCAIKAKLIFNTMRIYQKKIDMELCPSRGWWQWWWVGWWCDIKQSTCCGQDS